MRVCVGGTFNIFHKGHRKLLDKAFEAAGERGEVYIGLSTGSIVEEKTIPVKPFEERRRILEEYIKTKKYSGKVEIIPIDNPYGLTLVEDFDCIIVSPETVSVAREINEERKKLGRKPMEIVEIPFVLAEDDKPISSSRIHRGEIDEEGHMLG